MADASTPQTMSPKLQKVAEIARREPKGRLFALAYLSDEDELVRAPVRILYCDRMRCRITSLSGKRLSK